MTEVTDPLEMKDLLRHDPPNVSYGDKDMALANEILRTEVGSGVHGMAIAGTDDHDEMGIFIEPPDVVLALARQCDQHVSRTKPEGVRSGPGDVDLTIYSLRKFMRLACAGHPTIILPLFAPPESVVRTSALGASLRNNWEMVMSQRAGHRFLGYLDQQRIRMMGGGKRNRVPHRPELVEAHGYDTKYASHALRLGFQGIQVMREGWLSLPMREYERALCRSVKRGEVDFADVVELIDTNIATLKRLTTGEEPTPLPEHPDMARVNEWMKRAHFEHWGL